MCHPLHVQFFHALGNQPLGSRDAALGYRRMFLFFFGDALALEVPFGGGGSLFFFLESCPLSPLKRALPAVSCLRGISPEYDGVDPLFLWLRLRLTIPGDFNCLYSFFT